MTQGFHTHRGKKTDTVVTERMEDLLAIKFQEPEFSSCFLIEINLAPKNKLEIFIDSDEGVTFSTCQQISRYLEQHLDENGWLGSQYTLEVSSPGVSRPLANKRQYPRNVGRKMEITLVGGETHQGRLKAVNPDTIVLESEVKTKEGKKTIKSLLETVIPFDQIAQAIVQISF